MTDQNAAEEMTQHSPLRIPELLEIILSFASQSTLASSAVVCQSWRGLALDLLWKHLDCIFPLFELLLDFETLRNLYEESWDDFFPKMTSILSRADWSRFQSYATRIHSLSYDENGQHQGHFTNVAYFLRPLAMICLHCPDSTALFPNLKAIKWWGFGLYTAMLPLLSTRTEQMKVTLVGLEADATNDFFAALEGRKLNLRSFTLRCAISPAEVQKTLSQAISTWKHLRHIDLPLFYLTPPILQAVVVLPELETITLNYRERSLFEATAMVQELSPNAFPALKGFGFSCNVVSDALRLAQQSTDLFARLKSLHINASNGVGNTDVIPFVRHLGQNCRDLERIWLDLCLTDEAWSEDISALSIEVLESLFACRDLRELVIGHPLPITLQPADVEQTAAAWPKLIKLSLTIDPNLSSAFSDDLGNSWSLLPLFAQRFPAIRYLGLYFAKADVATLSGDLHPPFEFQDLDVLDVGFSAVPGELEYFGRWISSLCRREPSIQTLGSEWYVGGYWDWTSEERWKKVRSVLKLEMQEKLAGRVGTSNTTSH